MRVLGITAEYNPFHRGHQYQMDAAKERVQPDHTVIAMSGVFTQRGEPAIADKWDRSKWAVLCGADLVFELPFIFACNRAPVFAAAGVDLLVRAGATHISFGCEAVDEEKLRQTAQELLRAKETLAELTQSIMADGTSYAKAYEMSVRSLLGEESADLITRPNNILAVEYLKRIQYWKEQGIVVEAVPVVRKGAGYHEINAEDGYAGASQIRRYIEEGKRVEPFVPQILRDQINAEQMADTYRAAKDRYFQMLRSTLIRSTSDELADLYCVGEGIENKFQKEIVKANDLDALIEGMVSKRYTAAAVRRMLVYMALGVKGNEADKLVGDGHESHVPYLRVLSASASGRNLIRRLGTPETPLITNVNKQVPEDERGRQMLALDLRAADLYNAILGRRLYDYSDRVIRPYIETDSGALNLDNRA